MNEPELIISNNELPVYDLSKYYSEFVPFTINSLYPIHRWYRFKEGYSKDLVHLLIGSYGHSANFCLDPFSGSGTTPLVCQQLGINCYSFEVNPFFFDITQAKLNNTYKVIEYDKALKMLAEVVQDNIFRDYPIPELSTITESPNKEKWLFSLNVLQAILAIRNSVNDIRFPYSNLFKLVLASIIPEIGNTTKDGKCVRYKTNWKENSLSRIDVWNKFQEQAKSIFREDIKYIENMDLKSIKNMQLCLQGSALNRVTEIEDKKIDLVITSPPYLNSFDYTDVYMPELWSLGYVNNYEQVRILRESTFKSHVQIKWKIDENLLEPEIRAIIEEVKQGQKDLWNDSIPQMIGGYFIDIHILMKELSRVVKTGGMVCIIVGTSSYNKVTIPTDMLLIKIALQYKFICCEIKIIRNLKRSSGQVDENGKSLSPLKEVLIVLKKIE